MKQTIAGKIFTLAVFLLTLTIAIAVFLRFEADRTLRVVSRLVESDLPLNQSAQRISEAGLRLRLAFERWFGALNADAPNQVVVGEASRNFDIFTSRISEELAVAQRIVDSYSEPDNTRPEVVEIGLVLRRLKSAYATQGQRQREILAIQASGDHNRANELLNLFTDQLNEIRDSRDQLDGYAAALATRSAAEVHHRHATMEKWMFFITGLGALVGLIFASFITQRLTRPLRLLVKSLEAVRQGNLAIQVPVQSADEVGILTEAFNHFVRELQSKDQMKHVFAKYVDPRVVEYVLGQPDASRTGGTRRVMSVVFADLVGFTGLSERLTPSLMIHVLNRHFGLQSQAIQSQRGVVDKFIGDAVMAYYGPPFVDEDEHPILACKACLAQLAALNELCAAIPEITGLRKDAPKLDLRIGIASGDVVVGNLGSESSMNYTVIGDTVNLAARLESVNRLYGTRILLTEETARRLEGQFELREIDSIAVKGKTESVTIYELLALSGELSPTHAQLCSSYAEGLRYYRSGEWEAAIKWFGRALEIAPSDGPSRTMIARIPELRKLSEENTWNGIFMLTEK